MLPTTMFPVQILPSAILFLSDRRVPVSEHAGIAGVLYSKFRLNDIAEPAFFPNNCGAVVRLSIRLLQHAAPQRRDTPYPT